MNLLIIGGNIDTSGIDSDVTLLTCRHDQTIQEIIDGINEDDGKTYVILVPPGHEDEGPVRPKRNTIILPTRIYEIDADRLWPREGSEELGSYFKTTKIPVGSRMMGPCWKFLSADLTVNQTEETLFWSIRLPYIPCPANANVSLFWSLKWLADGNTFRPKVYVNEELVLSGPLLMVAGEEETIYGERYLNFVKGTTGDQLSHGPPRLPGTLIEFKAYVDAGQTILRAESTIGLVYEFV
ncbi:MAG: hypothetical protein GXN93_03315 [Candidatus Diapherotrites archaeon]|nr:hypothetical protein [Candidatus Diapherotrites archaeon]